MANERDHINKPSTMAPNGLNKISQPSPPPMAAEEEVIADVDEPPERGHLLGPVLRASVPMAEDIFTKSKPNFDRKTSLLTSALKPTSNSSSPVEEQSHKSPVRGLSCVSTWSNGSCTTAELTSDGGFTSPGTRASTPSPPFPATTLHNIMPTFNKGLSNEPFTIASLDEENIGPLHKIPTQPLQNSEQNVEAALGRKRRIMFACGKNEEQKPVVALAETRPAPPSEDLPKRTSTIKFACPSKGPIDGSAKINHPRPRMLSPPPMSSRKTPSPQTSPKVHRDSDSTVRNNSPVSVRKAPVLDRKRRMSINADLARCEAYRFHEFASSEEEVEEWTQEVTCHRSRLTVQDTLKIENNLRKLGEEVAEEEALEEEDDEEEDDEEEEEEEEEEDDDDAADLDDDDDDEFLNDEKEDSDAYSDSTDEGFQTDDEQGFAVSDDDSDAGSDYNWWAPGVSTAATSVEHLEQLRLRPHRTVSESSIGSLESREGALKISDAPPKRRKSRPVNIRIPNPELPDSTDFVCGTLDEDRPAEAAYLSALERRRAAKHKPTPQDIDPTFPTSDPELPDDEEDEVSEAENLASESDFMVHGRMEPHDTDSRGRRKRSPIPSPKRLRSPPPTTRRSAHRSPPPRKLFGNSPKRLQSPPPSRLRSPPPTRRGSVNPLVMRQRSDLSVRFGGIGERPTLTLSASVPRTPITMMNPFEIDEEDNGMNELPVRRAIDIQVGLEKKRQRRLEKLYKKQHRKGAKEKRPAPGRGAERMREMGLAANAHKGKNVALGPFQMPAAPEHVLSV